MKSKNKCITTGVVMTTDAALILRKERLCKRLSSVGDKTEESDNDDDEFYGATTATTTTASGKPYTWYDHPHMALVDGVHSFIARRIAPLHKLAKYPAVKDNAAAKQLNQGFRQRLKQASISNGGAAILKWGALFQCPILQYEYSVPRKAILQEWGLYNVCLKDRSPTTHDIKVYIRLPACLLSSYQHDPSKKPNEFGCIDVAELDLKTLPIETPLVIHFHGGGMTIGAHSDGVGLRLVHKMSKRTSKPIIHAAVTYSQAPEYTFPVAIEETLTVLSHFLEHLPDRRIHTSGISAGGNLAAVATMEMHRRYPGRISSSLIICPMLDPAANSQSYYLNQDATYVTSAWLRWCWRAYLGMASSVEEVLVEDNHNNSSSQKVDVGDNDRLLFNHDSNELAWQQCPWSKTVLARLVNPTIHVPDGLGRPDAPRILLTTNEADPLRDDGLQFAEELMDAGAKIEHMRHSGSHWNGTACDKKSYASLIFRWSNLLFPDDEQALSGQTVKNKK